MLGGMFESKLGNVIILADRSLLFLVFMVISFQENFVDDWLRGPWKYDCAVHEEDFLL
jgi:hypothetical protein